MKIRNGFVSNSSSSSFVLITTKENYDKVLAKATPLQKFLVQHARFKKERVFGKDCLVFSEYSYNDECFYSELDIDASLLPRNDYEEDYEKYDDISEAWNDFTSNLCKNENEAYSHYQSC